MSTVIGRHHSDNLDPAGREFLPQAGQVLTTVKGAEKVGGTATGLEAEPRARTSIFA